MPACLGSAETNQRNESLSYMVIGGYLVPVQCPHRGRLFYVGLHNVGDCATSISAGLIWGTMSLTELGAIWGQSWERS